MIAGVDEPSWPLMSLEIGVIVMTPLNGALAGTFTDACIVAVLSAGEKLTTTVVSIGVGQLGSDVARKPSFVTPRVLSAFSEIWRFAPLVALSPRTGLRKTTVGPFTIFTLMRTVSALFARSVSTPVTTSVSVTVSIGAWTRR